MMKNDDKSVEIYHNPNYSCILDHPYRIFITGGSGSGKTNVLLNLIKYQQLILTKFIHMLKIHLNQSINRLLMEEEK